MKCSDKIDSSLLLGPLLKYLIHKSIMLFCCLTIIKAYQI